MKYVLIGLFFLLSLNGCEINQEPSNEKNSSAASQTNSSKSTEIKTKPIDVVNLRMQAYNNHDIDKFLSVYADNVRIHTYPEKELAKGKKHLRSIFEPMFNERNVSVKIHHQIAKDSYVINHETVSYDGKETEYVSIYNVQNGLITDVRFVRD